ncbi:DUF2955 domain-containing protein [Colwelliaceae bacterium BS250]
MLASLHTKLHQQTDDAIRIIRFTIGVTIAIAIAFGFNWPLAFIAPVFVTKFLGNRGSKLPFKALVAVLLVSTAAFIVGILLTKFLLPFPVVFILMMTLMIFLVSYWGYSGGNEFVITMLLVGFTLVPMLGLLHQEIASIVTVSFLFSCLVALLITMVMHELVPDKQDVITEQKKDKLQIENIATRFQLALLSCIIIMPVVIFFFYLGLSSSILILIFVAILAQKPDLLIGLKGAKALMVGNTLGGIIAIIMYNFLTVAPTYTFLLLVFAFASIYFARLIFSESPLSPLYAMAFTTVIVLIANGTLGDASAGEKFYTRIIQIGCACGYVIFATYITRPWLSQIKDRYLQLPATTDK